MQSSLQPESNWIARSLRRYRRRPLLEIPTLFTKPEFVKSISEDTLLRLRFTPQRRFFRRTGGSVGSHPHDTVVERLRPNRGNTDL